MGSIIIILLSIILDGFLSLIISQQSYFQPLFTITSIYLIYKKLYKQKIKYTILSIIAGIIYDLLYTNLLFLHAILFYILTKVIIYIYNNYKQNILTTATFLSLIIIIYECLIQLILYVFKIMPFSIEKLIFIITHSLTLNIFISTLLYLIIKVIKKKIKA